MTPRLAREKERAKERKATTQFGGNGPGQCPGPETGRARDKAAAGTGYSGRRLDKVATVVEAAAVDATLAPVVEEMDVTGKVDPAYQKVRPRRLRKLVPQTAFERLVPTLTGVTACLDGIDYSAVIPTPDQVGKLTEAISKFGRLLDVVLRRTWSRSRQPTRLRLA